MKPKVLKDSIGYRAKIESKEPEKSTPQYVGVLYEINKDDFGNSIFTKVGKNTVTVGGAIESLEKLCRIEASWKPKTLNEIYDIEATSVNKDNRKIALFGVGVGGCGLEWGSVVEKDIKSRDIPGLIPLRSTAALTGDDADLYYLKKDNGDGTFKYYLKEFAVDTIAKSCWKDSLEEDDDAVGTEILDEIADSERTESIQTFAEFVLDLNIKDVREYYESIGALDQARYNSIGLFIGEKVPLADGTYEYADVRLFSYLNIDNKSVKIKTAAQYLYRILAIV